MFPQIRFQTYSVGQSHRSTLRHSVIYFTDILSSLLKWLRKPKTSTLWRYATKCLRDKTRTGLQGCPSSSNAWLCKGDCVCFRVFVTGFDKIIHLFWLFTTCGVGINKRSARRGVKPENVITNRRSGWWLAPTIYAATITCVYIYVYGAKAPPRA
jgi:hypothetical protein